MAARLVQIVYKEEHRKECYPFADVYFNDNLTMHYENSVITSIVPYGTSDKIAVCSWKLRQKMRWYMGRPRELTQEVMESEYEVLSFTRNSEHHDMFGAAETWHPGFMKVFGRMCEIIGVGRPMKKITTPIYQNAFSAKAEIYRDYIKTYLNPAMSVLSGELKEEAMKDSHYSKLVKDVDPDYLKAKLGVPFTPMAPFILERLFSLYVMNKKITVTPL
jgi:hypothetical protein